MKNLFEYFDKSYCINLDNEPERWASTQKLLTEFGVKKLVERISAVKYNAREYCSEHGTYNIGCGLSHKKCVNSAKLLGFKNVLVAEDDFIINPYMSNSFDDVGFVDFLQNNHWEYCAFSYIYWGDEKKFVSDIENGNIKLVGKNILQFNKSDNSSTPLVAYNHSIYDKFLNYPHFDLCIDRWNSSNFRVTAPFPCLAVQSDKLDKHSEKINNFNSLVRKYLF